MNSSNKLHCLLNVEIESVQVRITYSGLPNTRERMVCILFLVRRSHQSI